MVQVTSKARQGAKIPLAFPAQVACPRCGKLADRVHQYRDLGMVLRPGPITGVPTARTPKHAPAAIYLCGWCHHLGLRGPHDAAIYTDAPATDPVDEALPQPVARGTLRQEYGPDHYKGRP